MKIKNQISPHFAPIVIGASRGKKIKRGFAPLILVIVIGIVLAAGGLGLGLAWRAGLFGKPGGPTDGTTPNGTEPQPPPSDGEEDPTKDWKTYTNEEYGYSFKYPSSWYVVPKSGEKTIRAASYNLEERLKVEPYYPTRLGELLAQLTLSASDKPSDKNLRVWADELCADGSCIVEEGTIVLGGKEWVGLSDGYPSLLISFETRVYSLFITGTKEDAPQAWEQLELLIATLEFIE